MKWFILALKKYADFTGRSRRSEYWFFVLFTVIGSILTSILDHLLGLNFGDSASSNGWLSSLYSLTFFVPWLAVTVRRLHDIGKSGWVYARFILILFAVFIAYIIYAVMAIMRHHDDIEDMSRGHFDPAMLTEPFVLYTILFVLFSLGLGIWFVVLMLRDSLPGENKWGANPKDSR